MGFNCLKSQVPSKELVLGDWTGYQMFSDVYRCALNRVRCNLNSEAKKEREGERFVSFKLGVEQEYRSRRRIGNKERKTSESIPMSRRRRRIFSFFFLLPFLFGPFNGSQKRKMVCGQGKLRFVLVAGEAVVASFLAFFPHKQESRHRHRQNKVRLQLLACMRERVSECVWVWATPNQKSPRLDRIGLAEQVNGAGNIE